MKIIEYYLHTLMTLPLLYAITSSMIEFRFSKKKSFCIFIYAIMMTFVMEGLLFYKGVDSISIYSYGPFTTVLPSFLCLLYLSKHRNMSFLFLYLTETVLASIVTTMSYLLAYYIPGENWYVQSIIHTLLLLILYFICKVYLSQKFIGTVNNYSVHWGFYMILPVGYLIIWNMYINLNPQYKNASTKIKFPYMANIYSADIPLLLCLLVISFYVIILMMSIIVKNYSYFLEEEQKNALQFQITSMKNLQEHYNEKNESLRIYRHDMRHHFSTLSLLIENNEIDKAKVYLQQISDTLANTKAVSYCSNAIINSLLSYYIEKCRLDNIRFQCNVALPDHCFTRMLDTDLGAVITNILENALHAAQKVAASQDRYINFQLIRHNEQYILKCENIYNGSILLGNDGRPTSKVNGHGIGTQSILAFERKYNASSTYTYDDTHFSICLLFSEVYLSHAKAKALAE